MLPQSMINLSAHVCLNKRNQNSIFSCLTKQDIQRLVTNLRDEDESIRKASARLICELLCDQQQLKQKFLKILNIQFASGNIVLNEFPKELCRNSNSVLEIVNRLKILKIEDTNAEGEQKQLCWYIDPNLPACTQIVRTGDFPFNTFIDPAKVLFGIVSLPNPQKQPDPLNVCTANTQFNVKRTIILQETKTRQFQEHTPVKPSKRQNNFTATVSVNPLKLKRVVDHPKGTEHTFHFTRAIQSISKYTKPQTAQNQQPLATQRNPPCHIKQHHQNQNLNYKQVREPSIAPRLPLGEKEKNIQSAVKAHSTVKAYSATKPSSHERQNSDRLMGTPSQAVMNNYLSLKDKFDRHKGFLALTVGPATQRPV